MEKNLSYFMRPEKEEIVTILAPESFVDDKGKRIEMQVKTLSQDKIREITEGYRRREIALDKNGNPYSMNGDVLCKTDNNINKAFRHIIAEALVDPNICAKELMDYYKCYDKSELVLKVFSRPGEYDYVFNEVMTVLGLLKKGDDEVEEAKN